MAVRRALAALTVLTLAGCTGGTAGTGSAAPSPKATTRTAPPLVSVVPFSHILPAPVSARQDTRHQFRFTAGTVIHVSAGATAPGKLLAGILRPSTGYALPVRQTTRPASDGVSLLLSGAPASVGEQGYTLDSSTWTLVIRARTVAGLFNGVQTLHQVLPAAADARTRQAGPWAVPGGHVTDQPRYGYRGAMLDVARHFFDVPTVERFIDEISLYKVNYLHLHLSDDQGWRIQITGWPRLTSVGGATEVGGGPGGWYTQAQYAQIVAYAAAHGVTVVPEIDMPGHSNAALHAYGELSCNGVAPPVYTQIGSPNTSLCVGGAATNRFLDAVIGQLAALTPGPYLHIGGDEAFGVSASAYRTFIAGVQPIVRRYHKTLVGWDQIATANPASSSVAEDWDTTGTNAALAVASHRGVGLIMAPANHVYLDQKYTAQTTLGLKWAGYVDVKASYDWDPATWLTGGDPAAVRGVETPLWTETVRTLADIQYMTFPRLAAAAEIGWSPVSSHNWSAFTGRLRAQTPRWHAMGLNYYRSSQVTWP
jgi:hexosaminidase